MVTKTLNGHLYKKKMPYLFNDDIWLMMINICPPSKSQKGLILNPGALSDVTFLITVVC